MNVKVKNGDAGHEGCVETTADDRDTHDGAAVPSVSYSADSVPVTVPLCSCAALLADGPGVSTGRTDATGMMVPDLFKMRGGDGRVMNE